ncbi:ATP-dependent nuclease [Halorussus pelagicus]|uniref:ATP-dependent nuclease n=1 Tax=Halorussus pelagicus TaxID=2505977 RepID=UPI000FFC5B2C|nr:AAA family ATPase [Halorussus pelagicus]
MPKMELSAFRAQNFKSIVDSDKLETDDLNVFIGKNDAGKSSILEAIDCLLSKSKPKSHQFHQKEAEEITLTGTFSSIPEDLHKRLGEDYSSDGDEITIQRQFKRRENTTPSATTFVNGEELSKGAIIYEDERLTKAKSRNHIWEHFLPRPIWIPAERDVKEETKLKGGTILNNLLEPILKRGGIDEDDPLQEHINDLEDSLNETASDLGSELTENMQDHMPDVANINVDTGSVKISNAISPTISIKDQYMPEKVNVSERGSGVGSLLILSLMQTYVDMEVGEGYCLLFEEPGNFLHPAAERKMLSAIQNIAAKGQACISTHSQTMIDRKSEANLHVVRRKSGETSIEYIADDAFAAVDEIGARNSDILQSDFVIYVEGPTEVKVIEEIARRAIENWSKHNITIQHLGGTGNMAHCEPARLEKINRNFALLLDSDQKSADGEPDKKVQEIEQKFKDHGKPCKILERREIENYYSHESISEICYIDVDESFVGKYENMEEKINEEMDDGYKFKKIETGKEIVQHMYENEEKIEEIEKLLRDCVDKVK